MRGLAGVWLRLLSFALVVVGAAPAVAADSESAAGAERPVFLVTDIVVAEGIAIDKDQARDVLASRFGRLREKLEVRSLSDVKSTLDKAALEQMLGGTSSDTDLEKLGQYIQVDRVVFGRIAQIGGVVEVRVQIFNTKDAATEVVMSRRLKAGAPPQLVYTLLDSLADALAVWALDAYGDGTPSEQFAKLEGKKLEKRQDKPPAAASPWGWTGVIGAATAGAGVVALGAGAYGALIDSDASIIDIAVVGVGGIATVVGVSAVAIDVME